MNRAEFYIARSLRCERCLSSLSVPEEELAAELPGKTVALVGNARALAQSGQGARIDSFDVVVRINRAPLANAAGQGEKTDWLALAVRPKPSDLSRMSPKRVLWTSPKRKRLSYRISKRPDLYLHPITQYQRVKQEIGAPPTTGAVMIDLLRRMPASKIDLFGFDFFASLSLSGRRQASEVPHDFRAEEKWVEQALREDPRLTITSLGLASLT